jgi:hypothetical protein
VEETYQKQIGVPGASARAPKSRIACEIWLSTHTVIVWILFSRAGESGLIQLRELVPVPGHDFCHAECGPKVAGFLKIRKYN